MPATLIWAKYLDGELGGAAGLDRFEGLSLKRTDNKYLLAESKLLVDAKQESRLRSYIYTSWIRNM